MAMNNTQIHITLSNANVRDHLALMIEQNRDALPSFIIEDEIKKLQDEIKKLQAELHRRKLKEAAEIMIQQMGWHQLDLDGEPFIGTKAEYEAIAESQR